MRNLIVIIVSIVIFTSCGKDAVIIPNTNASVWETTDRAVSVITADGEEIIADKPVGDYQFYDIDEEVVIQRNSIAEHGWIVRKK